MHKELHKAQDDILDWCKYFFGDNLFQVSTEHDISNDQITMSISQPIYTDKEIVTMFWVENGKYKYDCRVQSAHACEFEFNHEKLNLSETIEEAMSWVSQNKGDTTLKTLSEIRPTGSVIQNMESEIVAQNILKILNRTKGMFRTLSWEEYETERLKDGKLFFQEDKCFLRVVDYTTSKEKCETFSKNWDLRKIYEV